MWRFPIMLFGLTSAFRQNLYSEKISNMIRQWGTTIESYVPTIQINRLYLATALMQILFWIPEQKLEKHIRLLLFGTDFKLIPTELDPTLFNLRFGLPGVVLILNLAIKFIPTSFPNYLQIISTNQDLMKRYDAELKKHISKINPTTQQIGLCEGISGVSLYSLIAEGCTK